MSVLRPIETFECSPIYFCECVGQVNLHTELLRLRPGAESFAPGGGEFRPGLRVHSGR